MQSNIWKNYGVTIVLIAINVVIFFLETIAGGSENAQVALSFGALYTPYVLENHEVWRLFTAMFLHFGIAHLSSNMVSLGAVGTYVERYFGHVKFLILYLLSGLGGNVLSLAIHAARGEPSFSAGASGAICGVLGAYIIMALDPKLWRVFPLPRVLFGIALAILPGLTSEGIDGYAHLGGLLTGVIVAACFYAVRRRKIAP